MKIKSDEVRIDGHLNFDGSKMIADEHTQRIYELIKNHLIKIATDFSGWLTLYQDPIDGRYWELNYPNSEIHGGGPPTLTFLQAPDAKAKYKL
ncbi:MAG TPA: Imm27 family immunity protein [Mucilaginibacter sp.]